MDTETFYRKCASLLGTEYICKPFPYSRRTRWNNRVAGSGRYPGYGIIRIFGKQIRVELRNPVRHSKVYESQEEVLSFLESLQIG